MMRVLMVLSCLYALQLPAQTKQIQYLSGTGNNNTIALGLLLQRWQKQRSLDNHPRSILLGTAGLWKL